MYAVIRTGGKQYCVEEGALLDVELLPAEVGSDIEFSEVLLISNGDEVIIGKPLVEGAVVNAQVVEQKKGPKKTIFKKIRRQGKQLKKGHRQNLTRVKVTAVAKN